MDHQHQRRIGELETELLAALRRIAELEIANQQLEKAAHEDPLTAIYNRRGFERRLEAILAVINRNQDKFAYSKPVYIASDIDRFKRVNDSYGHAAGDAVLQQFAHLLLTHVREYDIVGRFGGEEFLIALTDISQLEAKSKTESIANAVREFAFQLPDGADIKLTASFGVGSSIETADRALYAAKNSGRDRVISEKDLT